MMQKADAVTISPAAYDDMKILAAIAQECFTDPWSERIFTESFESGNAEIFVSKTDTGEITGYLVLSRTGDDMSVDDIAVAPLYRRCGIAKKLLTHGHSVHKGCDFLLEVRESNIPAISLYESLGYTKEGFRKRYYTNPSEGAVLMTRHERKF